jgi:hypothetical protein
MPIPDVMKCAVCGRNARCVDWDFNFEYRVMCDGVCGNYMVGTNIHANRAICKWNNQQIIINKLINGEEVERRMRDGKPTPYITRMINLAEKSPGEKLKAMK